MTNLLSFFDRAKQRCLGSTFSSVLLSLHILALVGAFHCLLFRFRYVVVILMTSRYCATYFHNSIINDVRTVGNFTFKHFQFLFSLVGLEENDERSQRLKAFSVWLKTELQKMWLQYLCKFGIPISQKRTMGTI